MSSPAFYQQGHPDRDIAHQTVRKIFSVVHGDEPAHEPTLGPAFSPPNPGETL